MGVLAGKKVIVIGASAGIGMATAAHALRAGAEVALSARGAERLQRAAETLAKEGGRIAHETLDMRDRMAVAGYLARQAPFDHLILSGATVYRTTFSDMEEDKAKGSVHAKFWGPFWAAYDARDHIRRGGSVVFYSGVANRRPVPGYVIGAVIDGAIDAATRSLAHEFAPRGIRVNCISPGIIETAYVERIPPEVKEELFGIYARKVPVGRVGQADDCALAAMYLMTNGYVTGEVIAVDGGVESAP